MSEKESTDKRKRSENSSVSETDISMEVTKTKTAKREGRKRKKSKPDEEPIPEHDEKCKKSPTSTDKNCISDLVKEINKMNSKLEHVETSIGTINSRLENAIQKGDETLKDTLKELLKEMKTDILKSVVTSIEVMESKLFDTEKECDEIKNNIESIKKSVECVKDTSETIRREVKNSEDRQKKADNELEQYSRRNNIKISGITDTNPSETAMESARKVISILKGKGVADLTLADIDIAHRMPNIRTAENRDIIVKLVSRMKKVELQTSKTNRCVRE